MRRTVSRLLGIEALTYVVAALIHAGFIVPGYAHSAAVIAESSIAVLLGGAWMLTRIRPGWTRVAALAAQGMALFWTMVGLLTIVLGVGPRTVGDVVYHVLIVSVLLWGLVLARRLDSPRPAEPA